jgi:sec-independent protein translocase protein TatB
MLPQFGFTELLFLVVIALVVLGPKDLSLTMRKIGEFVARGRSMANEFRAAFDDIARQAELDDLRKEIEDLKNDTAVSQAVDDLKAVEKDINESVMREEHAMAEELAKPASKSASETDLGTAAKDTPAPDTQAPDTAPADDPQDKAAS